jgi:DNA-binding MarR family transcriptional regulator
MGHAPRVSRSRSRIVDDVEPRPLTKSTGTVRSRADMEREVGELLMDFGEGLRRRCRDLLAGSDLKLTDFQMLHLLRERPHRMGELADELGYDASHITALVDRLETSGLVERQGDPQDRRVKRIVLTTAGRRRTDAFERQVFGDPELFSGLTPSQLRTLGELLRKAVGPRP